MPFSAVLLAGGALALGGMPPFNIFLSEFMTVTAGLAAGHITLTIFLLLLLTVVLAGLVRMVASVLFGAKPEEVNKGELGILTTLPMLILLVIDAGDGHPYPTTGQPTAGKRGPHRDEQQAWHSCPAIELAMGRSESILCGRTSGRRSKVSYETHVLTLNNDEKLGKGYLAQSTREVPLRPAGCRVANRQSGHHHGQAELVTRDCGIPLLPARRLATGAVW
ncbi:hydrogenase 4 subunit F [Serratia fonticola]|uniref:Hydrogenase 4 subunit F n=1 Tax=Serratia fonticola TaxID=47917 RepID=A0A4U9T5J0_SERFO|nr:hydrogenase 4 subunit F [Serratia fonticola]